VPVARRRVDPGERALLDLAGAIQALEEARPRRPQLTVVEAPKEEKPPAPTLSTYRPQPGPQTELETTTADEILFGGAAFGGKTAGVIGALRDRVKMRGYRAIVFRRSSPQLKNAVDRAKEIYTDGRSVGRHAFAAFAPTPLSRFRQTGGGGTMLFPAWGSRIEFGHLHTDDAYRDHLGQEYDDIVLDEGPEFTRAQYENLATRRRGIIAGLRRRVIVTANPPEDDQPGNEWIRQKWAPWINPEAKVESCEVVDEGGIDATGAYRQPSIVRLVGLPERRDEQGKLLPPARSAQVLYVAKDASGAERFSAEPFVWNGLSAKARTFIAAGMHDNPAGLEAEPEYEASLRQVDPVRYKQLKGDWTVKRGSGTMFRREWCRIVELHERPPESNVVGRIRCWDKAATEPSTQNPDPNWTRGLKGVLVHKATPIGNGEVLPAGTILVEHLSSCRLGPGERDDHIKRTADQDGKEVRIRGPQDPAQAGKGDAVAFRTLLRGFTVKTETVSGNKVLRAGPASSAAHPKSTGGNYGRIAVLRGDWNDAFFAEVESFPAGKDDIVDTLSDLVDELDNHTSVPVKAPPPPPRYDFESQPLGI
jgi:phage terminase large subunit-like protein